MTNVILPATAAACFASAAGVFVALSAMERPVWALMANAESRTIDEAETRRIHATLKRVIPMLPPFMATVSLTGAAILVWQIFERRFDAPSLAIASLLVLAIAINGPRIKRGIKRVYSTPSDAEFSEVRRGVRELLLVHHIALAATIAVTFIQLLWVIPTFKA